MISKHKRKKACRFERLPNIEAFKNERKDNEKYEKTNDEKCN